MSDRATRADIRLAMSLLDASGDDDAAEETVRVLVAQHDMTKLRAQAAVRVAVAEMSLDT